jgi:hypothetical protein
MKNLNKFGKEMQKLRKIKIIHVLLVFVLFFSSVSKNARNVKLDFLNKSSYHPNNPQRKKIKKIKDFAIKLKIKKVAYSLKGRPQRGTKFYKNGILDSDSFHLQMKEIELNEAGDFYDSSGGFIKNK